MSDAQTKEAHGLCDTVASKFAKMPNIFRLEYLASQHFKPKTLKHKLERKNYGGSPDPLPRCPGDVSHTHIPSLPQIL